MHGGDGREQWGYKRKRRRWTSLLVAALILGDLCSGSDTGTGEPAGTLTAWAQGSAPQGAPVSAMTRLVSLASARRAGPAMAPVPGEGACVGKAAGLYPDPTDCGCFYACSGFNTGVRACCTATIFWRCFNPEIFWCDLCANVDTCAGAGGPGVAPSPAPPSPVPVLKAAAPPPPVPKAVSPPPAVPAPKGAPPPPPVVAAPPPVGGTPTPPPKSRLKTATYWGQGSPVNASKTEPSLAEVCAAYDIVALQYLPLNSQDPGALTNLVVTPKCAMSHTAAAAARCASVDLSVDVRECQRMGKLVLLSLAQDNTTLFRTEKEAIDMADGIWNLYLAGTASNRPFGQLVLDGVDLQNQGNGDYYPAFLRTLWGHLDKAAKKYYLMASVGCRYPDPSLGALLAQDGNLFDFISVMFFDDHDCSGSPQVVEFSYSKHWAPLAKSFALSPPGIFIGLPAARADANFGYLNASDAASVLRSAQASGGLAGLAVYSAAGDFHTAVRSHNNQTWSQEVLSLVRGANKEDCT